MQLDHAWIASRIPHQGAMCLLHDVQEWNFERLLCIATSHNTIDNPLRARGKLAAACGIEYAAQAMAVHGALIAEGAQQRQGYLASVRGVTLHVARLDDIADRLTIEVVRFSGDDNTILYDFSIRANQKMLLEGRAAVFMQPIERNLS